ncbi:MAG: chloride channel protein [Parvibaculum sp.]|uniref:chloride channel protein n=1 Tax=Parvibaculum sp. TaxID=2024848 RepID=UPI00284BFD4C|nr:chloride channel protein [Parvibaculum sp.]MDR3498140.1 chloride channel protein [Parvibaculum sp.]
MKLPEFSRWNRLIFVQSRRWQRRLIFVAGGLTVGAAAVALALASDFVQVQFRHFLAVAPYGGLIVTPLGFGLAVYLTKRYFPNAGGSGIPQAIAARALTDQAERAKLVSIRVAVGKVLLTLLGLLVGASTGREGPTVQVGASIMSAIGGMSAKRQPGLILAGAAAGVAAAFNTPLAGIVFGIEEMSRSFEVRASGLIIGAIIAAGLTSLAFLGNYTYFGTTTDLMAHWGDWLAVPVIGVIGGLLGGLFSRVLILFGRGFPGRAGRWVKAHPVFFATLCGLGVALCGIVSGGAVDGTGYSQARAALHGSETLSAFYAPLKLIATALSSISGIPGGIFAPSLSVGAGIGADLVSLFPTTPVGVLVLLGMVSYFTGVVQAPITGFVIVSEMTDNHGLVVPLMLTAVIAQAASKLVCKEGVYHALAKNFMPPPRQKELPIPPPSA